MGIGCVYFLFFAGQEGAAIWPNDRVLLRLEKTLRSTDFSKCMFECHDFSGDDLKNMLENGDVEFSRSETTGEHKKYLVLATNSKGDELEMIFSCRGEISHLLSIENVSAKKGDCGCKTGDNEGQ